MQALSHIVTLCFKELRVLMRDQQAAALLFVMPAVFILLLSLALKDVYNEKVGQSLAVVVEAEDQGDLASRIEDTLHEQEDLRLVPRPDGMPNNTLFRTGEARAVIRIPEGFSEDARAFLEQSAAREFGENRIEWETSPTLDASYRGLLEARLALVFMKLVQDELVENQRDLGEDMNELGSVLKMTLASLEDTVLQLQDAVGQLENMGRLMEGTPEQLQAMAAAAMVEKRAADEATSARAFLTAQGIWDGQGLIEGLQPEQTLPVVFEPLFPPAATGSTTPLAEGLEELRERAEKLALNSANPEAVANLAAPLALTPGTVGSPDAEPAVANDGEITPFLREASGDRDTFPTPLQQTVPGWSLFAMFFLVVPLSQGLHKERSEGTLRRMRSAAVSPVALVLGKFLPCVLIAMVQFAGMLMVGLFVVPGLSDLSLDLGDQPQVLIPITVACSLAAAAYALLVASWTRTPEQAAALGATSIIILAVLGGVMVPHFMMPALLQDAALASPMYWGHQAYLDVFLHGAGMEQVTTSLVVLCGFSFVCLALASLRVTRS